jgi:RimJ/RimL family protein N-acetyltransferase
MNLSIPLFEGPHISLAPIDYEKDPAAEARWTHDPEFMRLMYLEPAFPLSEWHVKKALEKIEEQVEKEKNRVHFRIRLKEKDTPIGFADLMWISWSNGTADIRLGIGDAASRGKGYGTEALNLLLRYAFREANLFRLQASIPEYNPAALALFRKAGFTEEVRRREALYRDGRRWDLLIFGLLATEWEAA